MQGSRNRLGRRAGPVLALVAGLLALALPSVPEHALGYRALLDAAETRVDASLERNTVTFLSLSGVKAVLASIEGSAVGVGFHLEVGDLIQPAYDYVDFVWRAFLYALGLLGLYKLVMETGILGIGFPILGAGLVLWGAGGLDLGPSAGLRRWGRRAVMVGLIVVYVVPLSLLLSHWVSERYLVPVQAQTAERIEETREPLRDAADRLRGLRDEISILAPGRSVEAIAREAGAAAEQASEAIWERLQAFLAFVLILLVQLLLLPFLSAFVIYRALSLAARAAEGTRLLGERETGVG